MFNLRIISRDAPVEHGSGKGVSRFIIPQDEMELVSSQLQDLFPVKDKALLFLKFMDANAHVHFLAMDTIRRVEIHEQR